MKRKLEEDVTKEQNDSKLQKAIIVEDVAKVEPLTSEINNEKLSNTDSHILLAIPISEEKNEEAYELLIPKMNTNVTNDICNYGKTALPPSAETERRDICKSLIKNIHTLKVIESLKRGNSDSFIYQVTVEIVANFIKDKFSNKSLENEVNLKHFSSYEIKLLKMFQVIEPSLFTTYLDGVYINNANNHIVKNYFKLIDVCESVGNDNPISLLINSDCMPHMLSYLAPHSLSPELFAPVQIAGEGIELNS